MPQGGREDLEQSLDRSQAAQRVLEGGMELQSGPSAVTGMNELPPFLCLCVSCFKARFLGKQVQLAKLRSDADRKSVV